MARTKKVFKYFILPTGRQVLTIPGPHKLLQIDTDLVGQLCVWAEVEIGEGDICQKRVLYLVWTGGEIPEEAHYYVGMFKEAGLIWHAYCGELL